VTGVPASLFAPGGVAVVGATGEDGSVGRAVLENLRADFEGDVYAVNPNRESALGVPCHDAVSDIGDAVDLADLDGFPMDDPPDLLEVEDGERRASGRVRALTGLAVAIPLAPLALFLVNSVVPQTVWTAPVVFLTAWLVCGAVLSRARVPVEAFGRSLYLLALGTALVPVALLVGDSGVADDPATTPFRVVAVGAMVIAGVFLLLGRYVTLQGRRRVSGERRAFEDARE